VARDRGRELDLAERLAARLAERGAECRGIECAQTLGLRTRHAPYDRRPAVRQREEGQWPAGQESLPGSVPMRFRGAYVRHQGILMIGVAGGIDTEQLSSLRIGAVGPDQQL